VPAAWSPATPGPLTPPELDATVAPSHPLRTPQPLETAPEPHRGGGSKRALFLVGLLVLATGAAVFAFLIKPSPEQTNTATPTATSSPGGTPDAPQVITTEAYTLSLPGGWINKCTDQPDCPGAGEKQFRSAFVKGQGTAQSTLTIDRTRLSSAAESPTLATVIAAQDEQLIASIAGYRRAEGMPRTVALQQGRQAMELSFTSSEAPGEAGSVFAFKHKNDVYVVIVRGPDSKSARDDALSAVESLEPR
jgi:hypothetical protein